MIASYLLVLPFLLTAREMDANAPTAEVSAADVAGDGGHAVAISMSGSWWTVTFVNCKSLCLCIDLKSAGTPHLHLASWKLIY